MNVTERQKEKILAPILVSASLLILWIATGYDEESNQFPLFLGWLLLFFSLIYGIQVVRQEKIALAVSSQPSSAWVKPSLVVITGVAVYALAIPYLGYYLSTICFLLLTMLMFRKGQPIKLSTILLSSLVFIGLVYLLFTVCLGTLLPIGELWASLGE